MRFREHPFAQCNSGTCQLTCAVGFEDGDADPVNGCEASIIVDIARGEYHSCVVRNGGEVYCTGYDRAFGVAGPRPPNEVLTPRRIVFSDDTPLLATTLSAGEQHTCAIDTAGHLYCWGRNTNFRLGQTPEGAHSDYPVPVQADPAELAAFALRTFVQVSTAEQHSCARDDQGGIWCWGNGAGGALGLGGTADGLARVVALPRPAVRIATGTGNSAAILDDARVFGWGVNASGTLGLDPGVTTMVMTPMELFVGTAIRELAMGTSFACFIETDDSLRCVGNNTQLRLGSVGGGTHIPRVVSVPGTPETLFAGPSHACALTSVGVSCWGHNDEGEVGAGTYSAGGELPTSVVFPAGVTPSVLSDDGYYNTCVIAGAAYCWGNNAVENLSVADDDWTAIGRPEAPDESPLPLVSITAGSHHGCGATADSLCCWGDVRYTMQSGTAAGHVFYHEPLVVPLPAGVTSVISVGAGLDHTCFVGNNGSVYCSGNNSAGELGVAGGDQLGPVEVVGLPANIEQVVASANSTCARTTSAVHCFGETVAHGASLGRPLDMISGGSNLATPVPGLSDAIQLVAGRAFTCAIRSNGEVRCWGWDGSGQRGDGAEDDGIVNLPMPAVSVAASTAHACAVLMDGRVSRSHVLHAKWR